MSLKLTASAFIFFIFISISVYAISQQDTRLSFEEACSKTLSQVEVEESALEINLTTVCSCTSDALTKKFEDPDFEFLTRTFPLSLSQIQGNVDQKLLNSLLLETASDKTGQKEKQLNSLVRFIDDCHYDTWQVEQRNK